MRDLTRYRMKTVQARTSEIQRLGKALESAGIKLGSVASDITGKSATAMIEALIDGERRGQVLADLAKGRMRTAGKLADLSMALSGRFTEHHALLCRLHRDRIAGFDAAVAGLDGQIAGKIGRWQREAGLLKPHPRVRRRGHPGVAGRDRPRPAPVLRQPREAGLLGDALPGQQHQRPKAQARPHRRRRHLHQADADPGRLERHPHQRPAAGPVQQAGPPVRRGQQPRREEEGHHRDRAHPAQDRLPGPQERHALHRPGRGLLHPPGITQPSTPSWNAGCRTCIPAAPSPSPSARRRPPSRPAANRARHPAQPGSRCRTSTPAPPPDKPAPHPALATTPARVRYAARPPGPSFRVRASRPGPLNATTCLTHCHPGQREAAPPTQILNQAATCALTTSMSPTLRVEMLE